MKAANDNMFRLSFNNRSVFLWLKGIGIWWVNKMVHRHVEMVCPSPLHVELVLPSAENSHSKNGEQ